MSIVIFPTVFFTALDFFFVFFFSAKANAGEAGLLWRSEQRKLYGTRVVPSRGGPGTEMARVIDAPQAEASEAEPIRRRNPGFDPVLS